MSGAALLLATSLTSCNLDTAGTAEGGHREEAEPVLPSATPEAADASWPALDASAAQDDASTGTGMNLLVDARMAHDAPQEAQDAQDAQADDASLDEDAQITADAGEPLDAAILGDSDSGSQGADAAVEQDAGSELDASEDTDASSSSACTLSGSYALELEYDVEWRGTTLGGWVPLLRAGHETLRIRALLEVRDTGQRTRSRFRGCGVELPDFAAGNSIVGSELYGVLIPDHSWDEPTMPRAELELAPSCRDPGCAIASSPLVATLGARTTGDASWPGQDGPIEELVPIDHDNDGQPGITLRVRDEGESSESGLPYSLPPLSWTLSARATELFMGLQIAAQLDGVLRDCGELRGTVHEGRVENRLIACHGRSAATREPLACSPEQAHFVDKNMPHWTVSGGRFQARRLDDGADCAAARDARL